MTLHETNHLRKLSNEMGKQMRGPRKAQSYQPVDLDGWKPCARCAFMKASHNPKQRDYEHYRKEGMCESFVSSERP